MMINASTASETGIALEACARDKHMLIEATISTIAIAPLKMFAWYGNLNVEDLIMLKKSEIGVSVLPIHWSVNIYMCSPRKWIQDPKTVMTGRFITLPIRLATLFLEIPMLVLWWLGTHRLGYLLQMIPITTINNAPTWWKLLKED
jgi:hypothetical protein